MRTSIGFLDKNYKRLVVVFILKFVSPAKDGMETIIYFCTGFFHFFLNIDTYNYNVFIYIYIMTEISFYHKPQHIKIFSKQLKHDQTLAEKTLREYLKAKKFH